MTARRDVRRPRPRRLVPAAAIATIALAAWWALKPLPEVALPAASPGPARTTTTSDSAAQTAMDTSGFSVPLWVAPPAPPPAPVAEPPPPPPPPLRLRLIAIVREPGVSGAAPVASVLLYDPDADRLLSLAEGDRLGDGRTITRITESAVQVREPDRRDGRPGAVRTLALNPTGNGPSGGDK